MKKKRILPLLIAAAVIATIPITVQADSRQKIPKVNLTITSDIWPGNSDDNISIEIDENAGYTVESYDIIHQHENDWTLYDSPRITISIIAEDGYYFSGQGRSYIGLKGKDVYRYVDSKRQDSNSRLEVTVDLKPTGGQLGNPTDVRWTGNGQAAWTRPYNARYYEVQLYRNNRRIKNDTTQTVSYDFSNELNDEEHEYYFRVRSITTLDDNSTLRSNWQSSALYDFSRYGQPQPGTDQAGDSPSAGPHSDTQGEWVQNATGWWFRNPDGTWPAADWRMINDKWYYFDDNGYMLTGWQYIKAKWYYLGDNGAMYASTQTPDGYQVGPDGVWLQ